METFWMEALINAYQMMSKHLRLTVLLQVFNILFRTLFITMGDVTIYDQISLIYSY